MTSATGSAAAAAGRRAGRGFTLLEILLAVALIGLIAAALVSGAIRVVGEAATTPEEVFWQACQAARKGALQSEHEIYLSFNPKDRAFVATDGADAKSFPVPPQAGLEVDFLQALSGNAGAGSSVLVGGALVDTQTLPFVTFYPDGTCSPFRVQFRAAGPAHVLSIDPWTCAQVLTSDDRNP